MKKTIAWLLTLALLLTCCPVFSLQAKAQTGYAKVTSADELVSGQYVMIVDTGYAPGAFDNGWLTAVQPTVSNGAVTDAKGGIWTLTFDGESVTITDANGVTIAPKGGNTNGILSGSYQWAWTFADGKVVFSGVGEDTVTLASNTDAQYGNKFRAYKNSTVTGDHADKYPSQFTLYLAGEGAELPENPDTPDTPDVPDVPETPVEDNYVTEPQVGVAYKLGLNQTVNNAIYYFVGTMSNYYGASETDISLAVDMYLETAEGGYYLYFLDESGAKQYINIVVSGTHINFTFANTASSVFIFDTELDAPYTIVDGKVYYMGTYGNYVTFGTVAEDKVATSYLARLYATDEQPENPDQPGDEVPGDLDGVPGVDEDDAIYLLQSILMPNLFEVTQDVDFDGNGTVDEDDAIYLLQHVLMPHQFPLH